MTRRWPARPASMTPRRRSRAVLAALGFVTVLVIADMLSADLSVFVGLLAVGPFVAAAFVGAKRTALVGVYAVAWAALLLLGDVRFPSFAYGIRLAVIAGACGLAVWVAARRQARDERIRRLLAIAETAQRALLRPVPAMAGDVRFEAQYVSAAEEARIGGDLYEVVETPYGVRAVVGDARGKGLEAVQLAATVLGSFREAAWQHADLVEVARVVAASTDRDVGDEDFVTATFVEFADKLSVVSCGHPPPLHLRGDGTWATLDTPPTTPLGLQPTPQEQRFGWDVGDRLLLYTDGLVEARDGRGRFFPLEDAAALCGDARVEPRECLRVLLEAVRRHGGQLGDDLAVLLAERRPT